MTGPLYRLGGFCSRHGTWVLLAWIAIAAVIVIGARSVGQDTNDDLKLPGTGSQAATDLLDAKFPSQANGTIPIAFRAPAGDKLTATKYQNAVAKATKNYSNDPDVEQAVSPFSKDGAGQLNKAQTIGFISVTLDQSPADLSIDDANDLVDLKQPLADAGLDVAAGGYLGQKVSKPSTHASEVIGIVAAMVILLLTFGTAVAMGVPIVSALIGLATGMGIITILSHSVEVPTSAPALATMIGLGVGIDYALFVVTRHRAHMARGLEVDESIARAIATSGGAVVFAGSTVIIALCSLAAADLPLVRTLGFTAALVVLVAMIAAITLLPAVLAALGARLNSLALPGLQTHHDERPHGWARWAAFIGSNPLPALVVGIGILVVLAIPVFTLTLGQEDDGALPKDTQSRQSYDLMTSGFGVGSNGPILVAVDLTKPASGPSDPRLETLAKDLQGTSGVEAVSPPRVNKSGDAAVLTVTPTTAPSSEDTNDLVNHLRDDVIPKATKGQGMSADVGGTTAGYIDLADQISEKLPLVIAIVLALSFLILLLAFRSLLVPLKAVVMNVFSILAAFGVVTYVFDHEWTANLIGLEHTIPIVSYVPLMMFAILFGLSMDYEVFLMTHVREQWKQTADPHEAVVHGLASTARVITSAAAIMVSVFLAFVINGDPTVKQFGVGMAVAVAVDATVVRCVLVPAIMSLLGRAGWWMPGWLDRATPELSIEGDEWFAARDAEARAPATGS
jgi:RND superfamily putative drug exporter